MANRHEVQKKAKGGGVTPKHDDKKEMYNAKGSKIGKEAEEEKRGGKVKKKEHKAAGGAVKPRLDKKARGGSVAAGKVREGGDMKSSPFSAAHTGHGSNAAQAPGTHGGKG
jgi:hypothetical protein